MAQETWPVSRSLWEICTWVWPKVDGQEFEMVEKNNFGTTLFLTF